MNLAMAVNLVDDARHDLLVGEERGELEIVTEFAESRAHDRHWARCCLVAANSGAAKGIDEALITGFLLGVLADRLRRGDGVASPEGDELLVFLERHFGKGN